MNPTTLNTDIRELSADEVGLVSGGADDVLSTILSFFLMSDCVYYEQRGAKILRCVDNTA